MARRLLGFAGQDSRIFVSHDNRTIPSAVAEMVALGLEVPTVILVPQRMPVGRVIDEIALLLAAGTEDGWQAGLIRLPL